ncbi:MAG: hypothetical protein JO295_08250 [Verrucomicrobia bacterium]|nr:hypothetical protein [Verrucomicrobiota bacterium]
MSETILVDAGPLVALLVRTETHHAWAREQADRLAAPLHTCQAVLAKAVHLLRRGGKVAAVCKHMA